MAVQSLQHVLDVLSGTTRCPVSNFVSFTGELSTQQLLLLATALQANQQLAGLRLKGCKLDDDAAKILGSAVSSNLTLTTFELPGNNIGPIGAEHLAAALEKNPIITALDLSGNPCENDATKAMQSINSSLHRNRLQSRMNAKSTPTPVRRASLRTPQPAKTLSIDPTSVGKGVSIEEVAPDTPLGVYRTPEPVTATKRTPGIPKGRPHVLSARHTNENSNGAASDAIELEYRLQQLESCQGALGSEVEAMRGLGSQLEAWKLQMDSASTQVASVLNLVEKDATHFKAQFDDLQAWRSSVDALNLHVGGALRTLQASTQQLQHEMRSRDKRAVAGLSTAQQPQQDQQANGAEAVAARQQELQQQHAAAEAQLGARQQQLQSQVDVAMQQMVSMQQQLQAQHLAAVAQLDELSRGQQTADERSDELAVRLRSVADELSAAGLAEQLAGLEEQQQQMRQQMEAVCEQLQLLSASDREMTQQTSQVVAADTAPEAAVAACQAPQVAAAHEPFEAPAASQATIDDMLARLKDLEQRVAAAHQAASNPQAPASEIGEQGRSVSGLHESTQQERSIQPHSVAVAPCSGTSSRDALPAAAAAAAAQPADADAEQFSNLSQRLELLETKLALLSQGSNSILAQAWDTDAAAAEQLADGAKAPIPSLEEEEAAEMAGHSVQSGEAQFASPVRAQARASLHAHPLSPYQSSTHTSVEGDVSWWQNEQQFRGRTPALTQTASPLRPRLPAKLPSQSLSGMTDVLEASSPDKQPSGLFKADSQPDGQLSGMSEVLEGVQLREQLLAEAGGADAFGVRVREPLAAQDTVKEALEREAQRRDKMEAQLQELRQIIPRLQVEMLGMKRMLAERQSLPLPSARRTSGHPIAQLHDPNPSHQTPSTVNNPTAADSIDAFPGNLTRRISALAAALQGTPRLSAWGPTPGDGALRDFSATPLSASRPTPRIGPPTAHAPGSAAPPAASVSAASSAGLPPQHNSAAWLIKAVSGSTAALADVLTTTPVTATGISPEAPSVQLAAMPSSPLQSQLTDASECTSTPGSSALDCSPMSMRTSLPPNSSSPAAALAGQATAATRAADSPPQSRLSNAAADTTATPQSRGTRHSPNPRSPSRRPPSASPASARSATTSASASPGETQIPHHSSPLRASSPRQPWVRPRSSPPSAASKLASSQQRAFVRPAAVPRLQLGPLRGSPEASSYKPTQFAIGLAAAKAAAAAAAASAGPDAVSPLLSLRARAAQRKAASQTSHSASQAALRRTAAPQQQPQAYTQAQAASADTPSSLLTSTGIQAVNGAPADAASSSRLTTQEPSWGPIQDASLSASAIASLVMERKAELPSSARVASTQATEVAPEVASSPLARASQPISRVESSDRVVRHGREPSADWSEHQMRVRTRKAGSILNQDKLPGQPAKLSTGKSLSHANPHGALGAGISHAPIRAVAAVTPNSKPSNGGAASAAATPLGKVGLAGPGSRIHGTSPQATPGRRSVSTTPAKLIRPASASMALVANSAAAGMKAGKLSGPLVRPSSSGAAQQAVGQSEAPTQAASLARKPSLRKVKAGVTKSASGTSAETAMSTPKSSDRAMQEKQPVGSAPVKQDGVSRILKHEAQSRPASDGKPKSGQSRLRRLFRL